MNFKFEPHYEQDFFKFESQERVPHDMSEEDRKNFPWVPLGKYERNSPGRQLSFETHGEILGIESQEDWDKHVAKYGKEIFTRFGYHDDRIAPDREIEITQSKVDEVVGWEYWRRAEFEWNVDDMEKNGTDCEAHQDWLVRKKKDHGPDLDYYIRDDIMANETNVEFCVFRKGIDSGYDVALQDVAHVEAQVPELVEIRDKLRAELIEAVAAHFVSEFGQEVDEDTMKLMKGKYTQDKPIAKLVYMIEQVKIGKLVT